MRGEGSGIQGAQSQGLGVSHKNERREGEGQVPKRVLEDREKGISVCLVVAERKSDLELPFQRNRHLRLPAAPPLSTQNLALHTCSRPANEPRTNEPNELRTWSTAGRASQTTETKPLKHSSSSKHEEEGGGTGEEGRRRGVGTEGEMDTRQRVAPAPRVGEGHLL